MLKKYIDGTEQLMGSSKLVDCTDVDINVSQLKNNDALEYDDVNLTWKCNRQFKTFATATDEEIAEMVALADAGEIDLYEDCGWRVGQEHQISISAIAASGTYDGVTWSVGESQPIQEITLVLMHRGLYELVTPVLDKNGNSRNTCSFVVGVKDCLIERGRMNNTATNSGSWNGSARRNWCNGGFRQALPASIRGCFKQFNTITIQTYNGSSIQTSNDYFALPAVKEIFGSASTGTQTEADALTQIDYYKTSSNRVKTAGGSAADWWERTPYKSDTSSFSNVGEGGQAYSASASSVRWISPFGCI